MAIEESVLRLDGKRALVIGGSSGIGNGIAQLFRAQGASVHVCGTRATPADYAATSGSDLDGLDYSQLDVADAAAIDAWNPGFDRLDIVVLAQGAVEYRRKEFEIETFRRMIDVNLNSVMHICTKFYPLLKAVGGTIIIISSIGAYKSVIGNPGYAASKAGVVGLTRTLGDAWGHEGVRVNGIAPGMIATKMTAVTTEHPDRLKAALATISLGRLGLPEDVARAALYLVSPLASYTTGQTLIVDGGRSL
ncbi:SDR family NAD(P)-dependent oxidoreductase [Flavisphingomonas formosensis]|uniref:SDR family NAD(P)-dependent oxidoreductase n=1 Tax=Flavisphingomonas formosensis TaxID=861534 RepID=UPI0012FB85E2|nr:SDR family oxidoreductase [Sphingomonas formosensis]